jgi:glycerol-3-phosphate O-acyltransferase
MGHRQLSAAIFDPDPLYAQRYGMQIKPVRMMEWIKRLWWRFLKGTDQHSFRFLPETLGWLSFFLLKIFYRGIRLSKDQQKILEQIPKDAVLIYAEKYPSRFTWLFCYTRFLQLGLNPPRIGLDNRMISWQPLMEALRIVSVHLLHFLRHFSSPDPYASGEIQRRLLASQAGWVSLGDERGFYQRFVKEKTDPLRFLIRLQKEIDRPVVILPVLLFFSNKPVKSRPGIWDILFGTEHHPGRLRKLMLLFHHPGKVFFEVSEPVFVNQFLSLHNGTDTSEEAVAISLRRRLLNQIHRHTISTIGPVLKSPDELKQEILVRDRLREYLAHYAETKKLPLSKVRRQASEYIDEIAARYSAFMINIASRVVNWIINAIFDGVSMDTEGLSRLKTLSQKGPLILIPCHKSHIDYLILSYVLYHNDMPCPHIAAGKNLSFWPLGPIFRRGGAFFLRRSFHGAVLYAKVFSEYIFTLLQEGYNIEFFIEGGRSRSGKLILPKLGFLSMLIDAYRHGACNDLTFVPIFIGYDRVLEEASYLHEIEGGQKKDENVWQIFNARKFLKKRYGRIYIRFNEAISMNRLLEQQQLQLQDMAPKQHSELCRHLGFKIINAIDQVSVVTPHALVAGALLNMAKKRFSRDEILADIDTYLRYLMGQRIQITDTLLIDPARALDHVLDYYVTRDFIERFKDENGTENPEFKVITNKRPVLEYYKNNCIIFFIPVVFTSMAILDREAFQFSASDIHQGYGFLQHLFKNEFAYDVDKTPEYHVRKSIKSLIDDAVLTPHPTLPDTYHVTSAGLKELKMFARFLRTYFESYWIVLNFFMRYPKNSVEAGVRLKKIQSRGQRMYKRREIENKEALSRLNFKNAEDFFLTNGIAGSEDKDAIDHYAAAIQRYLSVLSS